MIMHSENHPSPDGFNALESTLMCYAGEVFGKFNRNLTESETTRITSVFQARVNKAAGCTVFDCTGRLTKQFRDIIVPYPDLQTFGYMDLVDRGIGNCCPSAVLGWQVLNALGHTHIDVVRIRTACASCDHVVLYDRRRGCDYNLTQDPFITPVEMRWVERTTLTTDLIVDYFNGIGHKYCIELSSTSEADHEYHDMATVA